MRGAFWLLAICISLAGAGCAKRQATLIPRSSYIRSTFEADYKQLASYEQLGSAYDRAGGATGIREVFSDFSRSLTLIVLRGNEVPALWLDLSRGREVHEIELQHVPAYVDFDGTMIRADPALYAAG